MLTSHIVTELCSHSAFHTRLGKYVSGMDEHSSPPPLWCQKPQCFKDEKEGSLTEVFGEGGSPHRWKTPMPIPEGGFCINYIYIFFVCVNFGDGLIAVIQRVPRISICTLPADLGRFPIAGKCLQFRQSLQAGLSANRSSIWLSCASLRQQIPPYICTATQCSPPGAVGKHFGGC